MAKDFQIHQLTIERFRGIEKLIWNPSPSTNFLIGGGDSGKTTVLQALGLLFHPSNSLNLNEADYWNKKLEDGFKIEATISASSNFDFSSQHKTYWPWEWDGDKAILPKIENDDVPEAQVPVFRVELKATGDFDFSWNIIQPDGSLEHFPVSLRKKVGLVKLDNDDNKNRDLRLVYGSALERLISDKNLTSRISGEISKLRLTDQINVDGQKSLEELGKILKKQHLPSELSVGLTGSRGISLGALIGLLSKKNEVDIPVANWGSGTRRLTSLRVSEANKSSSFLVTIDEIESGLEPYRLRQFVTSLANSDTQNFVTTHSPIAISCLENAQLWYMDNAGKLGKLDHAKIARQKNRDPETFLSKVSVIVEGETEQGFVKEILSKLVGGDPLYAGIKVCLGQGDDQMLPVLEALEDAGLHFAGFADSDGSYAGRWASLKGKMNDRLYRWETGCIETNILRLYSDEEAESFFKDDSGDWDGYRLRTVAERLGISDKDFPSIKQKVKELGITLMEVVTEAATGKTEGITDRLQKKEWKKHAQSWFKKADGSGGLELVLKLQSSGKWQEIEPMLRPFFNAVLTLAELNIVERIEL